MVCPLPDSELIRRKENLRVAFPSPTLLKKPTDAIPSIVSNITPIGSFPMHYWTEGPAIEKSGLESFDFLTESPYKVVDFDITGADGSVMKLNAVVTAGCADANTGFWGGMFIRDSAKMVATIYSDGDCCTRVEQVASNVGAFVPFIDSELDFKTSFLENAGRGLKDLNWELDFDQPLICETQFEKILGMAMDRIMHPPRVSKLERPKRPQSAYFLFSQEMRPIISAENPDLTFGQVARALSNRFSAMIGTEKLKKYYDIIEDDKKRYERELAEYNSSEVTADNFFERY